LRRGFKAETKLETVLKFLRVNEPEVAHLMRQIWAEISEVRFMLMMARDPRADFAELFKPFRTLVTRFVNFRENKCLFDYLPSGLRLEENYSTLFLQISHHSESTPDEIRIELNADGSETVSDNAAGCSARLNPRYRDLLIIPAVRAVFIYDIESTRILAWRADSRLPIASPPGASVFSVQLSSSDSDFEIFIHGQGIFSISGDFRTQAVWKRELEHHWVDAGIRHNFRASFFAEIDGGVSVYGAGVANVSASLGNLIRELEPWLVTIGLRRLKTDRQRLLLKLQDGLQKRQPHVAWLALAQLDVDTRRYNSREYFEDVVTSIVREKRVIEFTAWTDFVRNLWDAVIDLMHESEGW